MENLGENPAQDLSDTQIKVLHATVYIEIVIYTSLALFMTYLVYAFIIKLKFYRECHLNIFYLLAYLVIAFRLMYLFLVIDNYNEPLAKNR